MKKVLTTMLMLAMTMAVMAVPAKKGLWKKIQLADGTEMRATLQGDEFGRCWKGIDGKKYVKSGDAYVLQTEAAAKKAQARRIANQKRRESRLKGMRARRAGSFEPASGLEGNRKGLIVLAQFKDIKFQSGHDKATYENIANTEGYNQNGFKGSVADYFKAQSLGKFNLTFDVYGPVTVSKNRKYYGDNDEAGNDAHPGEFIAEVINSVKDQVTNWSQYDWDNDGEVDQVMVIFAGEGEASSQADNAAEMIWPHEWGLSGNDYGKPVSVGDNLIVNTYACSNDVVDVSEDDTPEYQFGGIGTICHEFSHCLGLPDMYDTSYKGFYGMNAWSLMDQGSYNGDGFVPSSYTSFDRMSIGWMTPEELSTATNITAMPALDATGKAYIIYNQAHKDEFYLLENRQLQGWDDGLPASGMLILHVDYDQDIWDWNLANTYNDDDTDGFPLNDHQRCTIFHADGVDKTGEYLNIMNTTDDYMEYMNAELSYGIDVEGDVYPVMDDETGEYLPSELSNTSTPRAFLYNANTDGRKLMNVKISNIMQNEDGTMAFIFAPDDSGTEEGDNTEYGVVPDGGDTPITGDGLALPFTETFKDCAGKGGNDNKWSGNGVGSGTFKPDNDGWTEANDKYYGGKECARFGTSSLAGAVTTPVLAINGTAKLTFKAAAWNANSAGTTLSLTVKGGSIEPKTVTLPKGSWGDFTATVTAEGNATISFTQEKGAFFLDEVKVVSTPAAIQTLKATTTTVAPIYTLDGRMVGTDFSKLPRGLYIVNGRKVVK